MDLAEFITPGDITKYITFHKRLNPKLWRGDELRLAVRVKLLDLALQFYQFLEMPDLAVRDVIFTGSNAAYNYTPLSDIDVHLIVNYETSTCPDLADNFFNAKKTLWNQTRPVHIRGFNTEVYVEDTKNPVQANGVYSLLTGRWLVAPKPVVPRFDDFGVVQKTEQYANEIDSLVDTKADIAEIERLMRRLRSMRQSGLHRGGEFSVENLTFKSLRNLGYLDKLSQAKLHRQSDDLSL